MPPSAALAAFQSHCHEYYTCFVFAADGMRKLTEGIPLDLQKYPNQQLYVGHSDPNEGEPAQSVMSASKAVANSKRDGAFPDTLAKALLVSLYAEWDERFRHDLAGENGVDARQVTCDLMGDLRRVRNWIVHNKSMVGADVSKILVLPWRLAQGQPLHITSAMLREFVDCINKMTVQVAV